MPSPYTPLSIGAGTRHATQAVELLGAPSALDATSYAAHDAEAVRANVDKGSRRHDLHHPLTGQMLYGRTVCAQVTAGMSRLAKPNAA
jgi:hypothetical protein